jgi:hypothetical protein
VAAYLYDRLVTDHEYVQRVRQQRPSALLPVIAGASARWHDATWWNSPFRKYTPWALADIARVSLAYGNEYRGDGSCTENDLLSMLAAYAALTDPMIRDKGSFDSVSSWLLRVSGEQFTFQESGFSDLARTAALFPDTDTFVTVCSASELENLVTLQDASVSRLLLERQADPLQSTYSLSAALTGKDLGRNLILDAGWDSYPWKRHADLGDTGAA